jgi:hypothetical protein
MVWKHYDARKRKNIAICQQTQTVGAQGIRRDTSAAAREPVSSASLSLHSSAVFCSPFKSTSAPSISTIVTSAPGIQLSEEHKELDRASGNWAAGNHTALDRAVAPSTLLLSRRYWFEHDQRLESALQDLLQRWFQHLIR